MPKLQTVSTQPMTATTPQVIWKLSASTACARTVGDSLPLASSATSGAMSAAPMMPAEVGDERPGLLVAVGVAGRRSA